MNIDRLDEIIAAICANVHSASEPGSVVTYSPLVGQALMGEMARRLDEKKRSYRQIVQEDILDPLKMTSTSVGVRKDLRERHIVPDMPATFTITHPSSSNIGPHGAFQEEHAEMPWVGIISSAGDIHRFAEALRRGGELDGARILGPRILDLATQNQTGDAPNELYKGMALARGWRPYPAYIGLGFSLRGQAICHHQFGTLSTPRTFGNHGAGSTLFWVDPVTEISFVCLTTKVLAEPDNVERFQRLSDLASGAAI